MTRLSEIRARLEKATPGEWSASDPATNHCEVTGPTPERFWVAHCETQGDTDLIANAPSDLRYLLGLVEECREGMRHIAKLEGLWPPRATNTVYEPMQTYPLPAAKVAADWLEKVEGFKL